MAAEAETLDPVAALEALNELRSNVVATQSASWSNMMYPFVAILNAAGLESFEPTEEQQRQHLDCYGGAGGYPGHLKREPDPTPSPRPVGLLWHLADMVRRFLDDPSDQNRGYVEANLERVPPRHETS